MSKIQLYPLGLKPFFQYRLWGGRRLSEWLSAPLPGCDPIGEAWLLCDREDHQSRIAHGPLKEWTIRRLMELYPEQLMGTLAGRFSWFPLLLKFLDAREMLSVQVHPSDAHPDMLPPGEHGKTEAWVVLEAETDSRIYAGLKLGTAANDQRRSLASGSVTNHLESFTPKPGDGVFLPAGTVHASGGGIVVFEVQQNSDVTFRLYDWDRIDTQTGQPRDIQVEQALACIDFSAAAAALVEPVVESVTPVVRERLFQSEHFWLWRLCGQVPFTVGAVGVPRVLVCLDGAGQIEHNHATYAVGKGDVMLLPAVVGACTFRPDSSVNLLEIALPEEQGL